MSPISHFHTPWPQQLGLPAWQAEDFASAFASFPQNIALTHYRVHVLAPHTRARVLAVFNKWRRRPVSESRSWMCESPTYGPLNQIGKADKPYLHSSVAGCDCYQPNFPPRSDGKLGQNLRWVTDARENGPITPMNINTRTECEW